MSKITRDFYLIISACGEYAFSVSIESDGIAGLVDCSIYDFKTKEKLQCSEKKLNGKKGVKKPSDSGEFFFESKSCLAEISVNEQSRNLKCDFKRCFIHTQCLAEITLHGPFEQLGRESCGSIFASRAFGFFKAEGSVKIKEREYIFNPETDIAVFERRSGNSFLKVSSVQALGWGMADEGFFAFADNGNEFIACIGDEKLERSSLSIFAPEYFMDKWENELDGISVSFEPFFNGRTERSGFLHEKADKLFGRVSFKSAVSGKELEADNAFGYYERYI